MPRVDVAIDPATEVWPAAASTPRRFTVTLTHGARDTTSGTVALEVPAGWPPVARPAVPAHRGRTSARPSPSIVRPPAETALGVAQLRAVARDAAGRRYQTDVVTVDYPHIRPRSYLRPAVATIHVAPLALPAVTRIGYVRGAADRVPEALQGVGLPVTLLDAVTLERGDLSRFDAIVVGPSAYETDSALVEANARLLQYARHGGRVLVQYQQQFFFNGGFAPYPMTVGGPPITPGGFPVGHDRVTDERAPIRLLVPADPAFRIPNRIVDADWADWVQERGLYFARSWDPAYRPLLETHDPGRDPARGRAAGRQGRPRHLDLHRPQLLPAAAGGRAGGVSAVREPARASQVMRAFRVTLSEAKGSNPGIAPFASLRVTRRVRRGSTSRLLSVLSVFSLACSDSRTPLVLYSPHGRDQLTLLEHAFEAQHPDIDVRWLDMGSQEILDRLRFERVNPAGRRLVRRTDHDLRPRGGRLAPDAVPSGLGGARRAQRHRPRRSVLSGVPHTGGDRVQQPAGAPGSGA